MARAGTRVAAVAQPILVCVSLSVICLVWAVVRGVADTVAVPVGIALADHGLDSPAGGVVQL